MSTSSLPSKMRAIVVSEAGNPSVLKLDAAHPVPQPAADQILVRNKVSGINFIDCYYRTGTYPAKLPIILGREAAGTIASLGSGVDQSWGLHEGDRVAWCNWTGAYAEYVSVPAKSVVKIPSGVSDEQAAGGLLMGLTAISLLTESYNVKKGDYILIHAAAGGTGRLMVQYAKSRGAIVIGTAGGPEKCKLAKENGVDHIIDYKEFPTPKDWLPKVLELTPNKEGVHAVFDGVGKDTADGALDVVKRKGAVVYFGAASGPVPDVAVARLRPKNSYVTRPTMENFTVTREEMTHYADEFFQGLVQKTLKVEVFRTYALEDVKTAHEDLEGRRTSGKLLLKI